MGVANDVGQKHSMLGKHLQFNRSLKKKQQLAVITKPMKLGSHQTKELLMEPGRRPSGSKKAKKSQLRRKKLMMSYRPQLPIRWYQRK